MGADLILGNLLTPPILFFALGMLATLLRSDLEIPAAVTKALALYLLFSIGMRGGAELAAAHLSPSTFVPLGLGVVASAWLPLASFRLLRRRLSDLRRAGGALLAYALLAPLAHAALEIGVSRVAGLPAGDALLPTVLFASASYIAVPAAMRMLLPQSNPGIYLPMALAVTFPFNIALGIPLHLSAIDRLWPGV